MNMKQKSKQANEAHKLALLKRAVAGWNADGRPGRVVVVKKPAPQSKGTK